MNKNTRKKTALSLVVLALVSFTVAFFSIDSSVKGRFETPDFKISEDFVEVGDFELSGTPHIHEFEYKVLREEGFVDNIEQTLTIEYELRDKEGEIIDGVDDDKPLVIKLDDAEMTYQIDSSDSLMIYTIDLSTLQAEGVEDAVHEQSYNLSIQLKEDADQTKYQGVTVDVSGTIDAQQAAPARFN